jgi:hypothetical protein
MGCQWVYAHPVDFISRLNTSYIDVIERANGLFCWHLLGLVLKKLWYQFLLRLVADTAN